MAENEYDPETQGPSLRIAKLIAARAADAMFCGFRVNGDRKIPHNTDGVGVAGDTPAALLIRAASVLADSKPCPGAYWGISMHRPIIQRGFALVCIDLDTKRAPQGDPIDIRIKRLAQIAKDAGHLYERSISMKGAHIWLFCQVDRSIPKKISLAPGQDIEIFGLPQSSGSSVMLPGIEMSGTLQVAKLSELLESAGIDLSQPAPPERLEAPTTSHEKTDDSQCQEMLAHIVNADLAYDDWLRICMAAKSAGASEQTVRAWSASSAKHDDRTFDAKWPSWTDKPDGVGLGTLKRIAYDSGWSPDWTIPIATQGDTPGQPKRSILVPLDESNSMPMPTVIQNVLPQDGVGLLWAPPGAYKSFVAMDWLLSVGAGIPWLGNKTAQGEVWLLAGEGHQGLSKRVRAWRKERDFTGPINLLHSRNAIILDTEDRGIAPGLAALLKMIEDGHRPSIICVDTLNRSMVGDESATKDATRYIAAVGMLQAALRAVKHPCCLILVHHAIVAGDRMRGSSTFLGAADFVYKVERTDALRIELECTKWKDDNPPATLHLEANVVDLGQAEDNHGDIVAMSSLVFWLRSPADIQRGREAAIAAKHESTARQILSLVSGEPMSRTAILEELRGRGVKIKKEELLDLIQRMVEGGDLEASGTGRSSRVSAPSW